MAEGRSSGTSDGCFACGRSGARDARGLRCPACGLSLAVDGDGVLRGEGPLAEVSYPAGGSDECHTLEASSWWFRHRQELLTLVLDRFAPGAAVWDVGGGNGFHASALQAQGREVVLVEPLLAGCRNAAGRGVATVVNAELERLRLPGGRIPALTLLDVIEHVRDPAPLLRECRRLLRDDGRLVITVPASVALWSAADDHAGHWRRYSKRSLRGELEGAGLRLLWASRAFGPLVAPLLLLRSLPYRLGRARPAGSFVADHQLRGVAGRVVEALLAAELRAVARGAQLRVGTSIVAVAAP